MMKHSTMAACLGLAGVAVLGITPAFEARAQDSGITILSNGEDFTVRYGAAHRQNLVGGAGVGSVTPGEGGGITYADGPNSQARMLAVMSGGGDDRQITYTTPADTATSVAGLRPAGGFGEVASAGGGASPRR
ncbi:MAG: hypothetical protein JWP20_2399 [Roseomonas sp.]|nr:hypothetical protein [Roseomonas sp.]